MEAHLQDLGIGIWNAVQNGYTNLKRPPKYTIKKELEKNNKTETDATLNGLPGQVKDKIGKCVTTEEAWDKLQNIYIVEKVVEANEELVGEEFYLALNTKNPSENEENANEKS